MSWQASHWAKESRGHRTITDKALLLILGDYTHPESWECFPSQDRLARDLECSVRTIQRSLDSLEQGGYITTLVQGNQHQHSIYQQNQVSQMAEAQIRVPDKSVPDNLSCSQKTPLVYVTPVTSVPDTGDAITRRINKEESSVFSEEKTSSSSRDDDEEGDPLPLFTNFYSTLPSGLRSAITSPARYFETWGDDPLPENVDLGLCRDFALSLRTALYADYEDSRRHTTLTFPGPLYLQGIAECALHWQEHQPGHQTVRFALYEFVRYDDDKKEPEVRPHEILERIARRPDLWQRSLSQHYAHATPQ